MLRTKKVSEPNRLETKIFKKSFRPKRFRNQTASRRISKKTSDQKGFGTKPPRDPIFLSKSFRPKRFSEKTLAKGTPKKLLAERRRVGTAPFRYPILGAAFGPKFSPRPKSEGQKKSSKQKWLPTKAVFGGFASQDHKIEFFKGKKIWTKKAPKAGKEKKYSKSRAPTKSEPEKNFRPKRFRTKPPRDQNFQKKLPTKKVSDETASRPKFSKKASDQKGFGRNRLETKIFKKKLPTKKVLTKPPRDHNFQKKNPTKKVSDETASRPKFSKKSFRPKRF